MFKDFPVICKTGFDWSEIIGNTKNTIKSIKNREHWNMQNISPRDPVLLALCKQSELTEAIAVAKKKAMKNK